MKKVQYSLLAVLFLSLLILAGCGETPAPVTPGATATPAPTAEPTPEPTPVPTPIPYELAAANSEPSYSFASDYGQVSDALNALQQVPEDLWMNRFVSAGADMVSLPELSSFQNSTGDGDIIAAGDSRLYILNNKDLLILSLDGETNSVLSRTKVGIDWTGGESENGTNVSGYEKSPLAVYSLGDIIAVVSDWYGYHGSAEELFYTEYTSVDFFRVSDPTSMVFLSSFGQDGLYKGSRLGDNGVLTLVTDFTPAHTNAQQPDGLVPAVYSGGSSIPLSAEKVLLTEALGERPQNFAVLGGYSLTAPGQTDVIAVPGLAYEDISLLEDGPRFIRRRWAESSSRIYEEGEEEIHEYAVTACTDIYHLGDAAGALSVESVNTINGLLSNAAAFDRQNSNLLYAASLCQGLYTLDPNGEIKWRETMTGTRIASLDTEAGEGKALELPATRAKVQWVGLLKDCAVFTAEDGQSYLCLHDGDDVQPLEEPLRGGTILPWGDEGYMAFYRTDGSAMTLSVRDEQLQEVASRSFGSDHSNTLESRRSYYTDAQANILGFAADDSYCFYGFSEEEGLYFRTDVFLKDWAWNARLLRVGDYLIVADTVETYVYDESTLQLLSSLEL